MTWNIGRSILLSIATFYIALPATAALTVHAENDIAIDALYADTYEWILNPGMQNCAAGRKLLDSAIEFKRNSTLDANQKTATFNIVVFLESTFQQRCVEQADR